LSFLFQPKDNPFPPVEIRFHVLDFQQVLH
jgi:hypothetical protein